MPIPDLSNKPGPGRPGWGPIGSYDFKFEVTGNVTFKAIANSAGTFSISYPCLLYTSPSPRDRQKSRMPSSA